MTFDIYTNRIPFGLLTDEEKAALQAHKGEFEFCNSTTQLRWNPVCGEPVWYEGSVYRAVLELLRPADPPWDVIRKDVVAWARDNTGESYWYNITPTPCGEDGVWLNDGFYFVDDHLDFDRGNMPWDQSLVLRPGVES